jgi:hypothetical protein
VLSERDRAEVNKHLGPLLEQLAEIFGSRTAACQTLLAHLATDDEIISRTDAPTEPVAKEA